MSFHVLYFERQHHCLLISFFRSACRVRFPQCGRSQIENVRHEKAAHLSGFFMSRSLRMNVLPVGIEPTLQAPQACVLSIERRERVKTIGKVYFHYSLNEAPGSFACRERIVIESLSCTSKRHARPQQYLKFQKFPVRDAKVLLQYARRVRLRENVHRYLLRILQGYGR